MDKISEEEFIKKFSFEELKFYESWEELTSDKDFLELYEKFKVNTLNVD